MENQFKNIFKELVKNGEIEFELSNDSNFVKLTISVDGQEIESTYAVIECD